MLFLQITKSPQALPNETTRTHNDLIPSHSPSEFPRPIPKAKMQPPLQVFYLGANRPIICKVYGRTSMCVKLNRDIISRMEVRSSTSWPVSTALLLGLAVAIKVWIVLWTLRRCHPGPSAGRCFNPSYSKKRLPWYQSGSSCANYLTLVLDLSNLSRRGYVIVWWWYITKTAYIWAMTSPVDNYVPCLPL